VKPDLFVAGPRKVKCARCAHIWPAEPDRAPVSVPDPAPVEVEEWPEEAAAEANPDAEVSAQGDDPRADDKQETDPTPEPDFATLSASSAVADEFAGLRADPFNDYSGAFDDDLERRRTPLWVWSGWAVIIALLAATVFGLVFMRTQLVEAWPPLQRLYDLSDHIPSFESPPAVSVSIQSSQREGDQMTLSLLATNNESLHQSLPPVLIELLDHDSAPVGQVQMTLKGQLLSPRESRSIPLVLEDLPAKVALVRVKQDTGH